MVKDGIHPKYETSKITCACGHEVTTRSTAGDYSVDICSNCHPFYTGKQKLVDSAGRVERFRRKYAGMDLAAQAQKPKKAKKAKKK